MFIFKKKKQTNKKTGKNKFYILEDEFYPETYEIWKYNFLKADDEYICSIGPNNPEMDSFTETYILCDYLNGYISTNTESIFYYLGDKELKVIIEDILDSADGETNSQLLYDLVKSKFLKANYDNPVMVNACVDFILRKNKETQTLLKICDDITENLNKTDYTGIYEDYELFVELCDEIHIQIQEKLSNNSNIVILYDRDWFNGYYKDYYTHINMLHKIFTNLGINTTLCFTLKNIEKEATDYLKILLETNEKDEAILGAEVIDYIIQLNLEKYGFTHTQLDAHLEEIVSNVLSNCGVDNV